MQKYYCRKESTGKETVQNQIQRGDAVFRINGYYVIIPQFLYDILLFGGSLASLAALGMLAKGIVQKKKKTYFIRWILILSISSLLFWLTYTGKLCGHMMVGG